MIYGPSSGVWVSGTVCDGRPRRETHGDFPPIAPFANREVFEQLVLADEETIDERPFQVGLSYDLFERDGILPRGGRSMSTLSAGHTDRGVRKGGEGGQSRAGILACARRIS